MPYSRLTALMALREDSLSLRFPQTFKVKEKKMAEELI
jgi:hypothetical protein